MVGHRQIQTKEVEDRANQTFGLTECQTKHRPQCQGGADCQG
jgi:hypothetical protein